MRETLKLIKFSVAVAQLVTLYGRVIRVLTSSATATDTMWLHRLFVPQPLPWTANKISQRFSPSPRYETTVGKVKRKRTDL